MITNTLRSAAVLLGVIILSVMLGGQSALARTYCPCLTGELVDAWFPTLPPSVDQQRQIMSCADERGFMTFDYFDHFDRSAPRSIYIDLRFQRKRQQPRCVVELSPVTNDLTESSAEITNAEAKACRKEILRSQVWSLSGCPDI